MAGTYDGQVRINTKIDYSGMEEDLRALHAKLQTASEKLRDVMQGPVQAIKDIGQALQKVGQIVNEVEGDWAAQEKAIAINKATLKATGAEAWTTTEAMQALADKLQKITGYADENILSMQNVLLGFKNIKGDNFDVAAEQILNMSKVMDMDLVSSAQAVGKALDDPIAGVDSLTRQGFRFSAAQKEVLKDLVNTGHMAEAQKIILDELTTTYGGAAAAANETSSAIKEKLGVAVGELRERLGKFATDALAPSRKELTGLIEGLTKTFDTINANQNAPEVLTRLATGLGAATAGVAAFVLVSNGAAIVDAMAAAITALNVAIMANPYALLGAALAALVVSLLGAKKAEEEHEEAIKNKIARAAEEQKEVRDLADEYQNLYDKVSPSADEQSRMADIAKTLHERFPDVTTDTLNLAAANKTLAENAAAAADAQARNLANQQIPKLEKEYTTLAKTVVEMEDNLALAKKGKNVLPGGFSLADYEKEIEKAKKKQGELYDEIVKMRTIALYGIPAPGASLKTATTGGGSSTTSTAIPQGTRLKTLDEEYKARVALAESNGEDVAAIEKEWYDKRLAMLGDFVVEDAKKGIKLEDSLKSSFAGYAEEGSDDLRQLGKEIDATRFKVEKYKDAAAGDTMFTPIDWNAASAAANGTGAPDSGAADAQEWADEYLGKAAFNAIMQAVSEGLNASDTEEWVQEYLGKQAFETLQASASEALSASDAEEWVQTYLGDEAFKALQAAATEGLQAADTQEWIEDYLGAKAFKALQDAAEDGLQAADVAAWSEEYLGKNVFESLMAAADEGLQSAAVQEWCDDYLGKGAFDALQAAAEEGLQAADVEEWAADYLGKQVFDAMSEAATLGLQEADVAEWVADYLNEKKLANALDAEDMKIQAAAVAAWIADYKKNHGTVAEGGDGWVAYERYLEEMRQKTTLAPWQQAGIVGTQGEGGAVSGGTELGNLFAGLTEIGKAFSDSIGGILSAVGSLASVQQILNPLTTVFDAMMDVLRPVINDVLGPVVGMLKLLGEALGQILAPAIKLLTPIIEAIAKVFVFLYNSIIVPVGNAIIKAFNWIYNGIVSVLNWIIKAINDALGWLGVRLNEIAKRGADEGTLTAISEQDIGGTEATDALKEQNEALKANRELWTLATKAADAYASILTKVKGAAASFYDSMKDVGAVIASTLIDNLVNGLSGDDFLYAMQEYIRSQIIKATVYTDSLMATVTAIGKKINDAITYGATSGDFSALAAELRALWEAASERANIVIGIIDEALGGSYDVGSLSVRGDQYAKIHDSEMILPAGIAEEARRAGVVIGPAENLNNIGAAGMAARQQISLALHLDGSITADGQQIGRIAYQYFDKFAGSAYGD